MPIYRVAVSEAAVNQTIAILHTPLLSEKGAAFWFLQNNKEIKIWADLLKTWQDELSAFDKKILTWPDTEPIDLNALLAFQSNQNSLILTTTKNLETMVPNWQHFYSQKIELNLNQEYLFHELIKDLVSLGFSRETNVGNHPSFSVRGQIIDIFQNDILYRLEYEINKITHLTAINTLDNQSKEVKTITIWPVNAFQKQNLWKALPKHCLLIYNFIDKDKFLNLENQQIIIDPLASRPDFSWDSQLFRPLLEKGVDKIKFLKDKKDHQIFWFSRQPELAKHIIGKNKLSVKLIDWQNSLVWPEMMIIPKAKIITVHDQLFFLADAKNGQDKTLDTWLPDFQIGDLVVHRDHGLAKLSAIQKMTVDNLSKEYFVLSYAKNDTLFVGLDMADKLEKYLGPPNPKINRLSVDNAWPQTLRKIKSQTLELAGQLLNIEATRKLHPAPRFKKQSIEKEVERGFAYQLTPSQNTAWQDVQYDLEAGWPQDRLICGDVGFGKTEVALRAAARVVASGYQVALLCPTTILAQQHFDNLAERLTKLGIKIALLTRWQKPTEIKKTLAEINAGRIDIVVGTHRLLSRDIQIPKLQLLIIDEEQNFGVADKEKLKKYKSNIHVLTLTATPIPRTLHLALAMIKDISLITDPIQNRKNIITEVLPEDETVISQAISRELERHGQIYFLHNRVETIDFAYKKIKKLFPKAKVAVAHGQLPDGELASIMHKFDTGHIDILICSTIIANGLDIPRANTLIVTEATRFGLSQLHQLRGRIGRSDIQAYAYFLYSSLNLKKLPAQRLSHLKTASSLGDGFKIASRDLELRGVGQILGKAQSGKVKTIGLGMYQALIAETIAELKGEINKPWRDIDIKLPLDTTLADGQFKDIGEKISFYQKVGRQKNLDYINDKIKSAPIDSIKNVWLLQKIKVLVQNTNIFSIQNYRGQNKEYLSISFLGAIDFKKIEQILEQEPNWRYANNQLKINLTDLPKNWLIDLEAVIKILAS